jgi:hypothetical protein
MATQQQTEDNSPHPADRDRQSSGTAMVAGNQSALPVAAGETSSSAIAARARAEVEARFLYAARVPRDFMTSRRRLLDACKRPGFAAKARYAKPIGGGKVFGLSIRFAEEARVLWGNMDVTAMIAFDDAERRIYRVSGVDLETNATDGVDVVIEKFVERRNPSKGSEVIGQRLNTQGIMVYRIAATEDDLLVKVNNQLAKAKRNIILALLPADVKEEAEVQILETQKNEDAKDPQGAVKKIVDAFWPLGVTPAQLVELMGHPVEQTTPAELVLLRTYYQTLSEGEGTWGEIFEAHTAGKRPEATGAAAAASNATTKQGSAGLKERLGEKKAAESGAPAKSAAKESSDLDEDAALLRREQQQEGRK